MLLLQLEIQDLSSRNVLIMRFISVNSLKRQNKLFGGLISDIRRRYPLYLSDIKDGFNMQCLATIVFVYFGCVAGNIAFGGLMGTNIA